MPRARLCRLSNLRRVRSNAASSQPSPQLGDAGAAVYPRHAYLDLQVSEDIHPCTRPESVCLQNFKFAPSRANTKKRFPPQPLETASQLLSSVDKRTRTWTVAACSHLQDLPGLWTGEAKGASPEADHNLVLTDPLYSAAFFGARICRLWWFKRSRQQGWVVHVLVRSQRRRRPSDVALRSTVQIDVTRPCNKQATTRFVSEDVARPNDLIQ